MTRRIARFLLALPILLAGCTTEAINKDAKTTFLDSTDLVTMTDQMAHSIVADPQVAGVIAQKPMIIVMKPIINETNEIIRKGVKELYVHRVRVQLSGHPMLRDKFVFVLNQADYDKLRSEEGLNPGELGPTDTRVQPEYALTGTFYVNTNVSTQRRSDTYLCTFRLTNLATGLELWEGKYETSKHIKKEFLD
jgi:PBP1b-binding outer membrane lipoprotein LpoB